MKRSGRFRKLFVVLIAGLVIIAVVVAFLPTIASTWPGPGLVENILEKQINGTATVKNVTLRWAGPQSIEGLVIHDDTNTQVADLDIHLKTSFLSLALSNISSYTITLSGSLNAVLRDDHTISFSDLLRRSDNKTNKPDKPDTKKSKKPNLAGFVPVHITILDLQLQLDDDIRSDQLTVNISTGELTAALGKPISFSLNATAARNNQSGDLSIGASIDNLLQPDGSITTAGASLQLKLTGDSLPLPGTTQVDQLDNLNVIALANDLSQKLDLSASAVMVLTTSDTQANASSVSIEASVLNPINDQLQPNISPQSITGTIEAQRIPTDLLQIALAGALADSPIDLRRDLGPSLDVRATAGTGDRRAVSINLSSAHATVDLTAVIDTPADADDLAAGAIDISSLNALLTIQPELLAALTDAQFSLDRPTPIRLDITDLQLPGTGDNNTRRYGALAGNITVLLKEPFVLSRADDSSPIEFEGAQFSATTKQLSDTTTIFGTALINSGKLTVSERLTGIIDKNGSLNFDWRTYQSVGEIKLQHLPGDIIAAMIPDAPPQLQDLLNGPIDVQLTTTAPTNRKLLATLDIQANEFSARATATRDVDALRIDTATLTMTINPELVRSLQKQTENPIELESALPITMALVEAFTLPANDAGGYDMPPGPLFATINTNQPIRLLNIPALAEPLELRNTSINSIINLNNTKPHNIEIIAGALWHTQSTDQTIGEMMFEAALPIGAEKNSAAATATEINITLKRLAVRRLERALGRDAHSLAKWIGPRGNLKLTAKPNTTNNTVTGSLHADFTQLAGEFDFNISDDEVLSLTGGTSELTIAADALNDWLRMKTDDKKTTPAATITSDVTGSLNITTLSIPLAMLNDQPFDPKHFTADITIAADQINLLQPDGTTTTIENIQATINADDLAEPVGYEFAGNVQGTSEQSTGTITSSGQIIGLLNDQNQIDTTNAVLDMTLTGSALPIALADSLGGYDGLLVAALGSTAQADIKTKKFSPTNGALFGTFITDNGTMNVRLLGRKNFLRIRDVVPMQAELEMTPSFRDRVLQQIHPIFADIRSVEQPFRVTINTARIPINGDVSQLDADIKMTVGDIELDSGSLLLTVLDLFNSSQATVPGRIEPIQVTIRKGVITYDRFSVILDKYTLDFLGQVDLNTRQVDLRFELPGSAMSQTFSELEGYVEGLVIPLRTHGTIGNVKTEIDPDYNIVEEAAKAGFRGAIEKEIGNDLGGLLDDLLNQKSKDKKSKGNDDKQNQNEPKQDEP